jgi:CBS domain-containing protein
MQARDIMTERPACCTPDDTIADAAKLMADHDCGCIPVVAADNDACVLGVITDRDIAVRGIAHHRSEDTPVRDVMTPSPFCCTPDSDVRDVEEVMSQHQVRRVVVADDDGCLIGMIAQADLARTAARSPDVSDDEVGRVVERISEPSQQWVL